MGEYIGVKSIIKVLDRELGEEMSYMIMVEYNPTTAEKCTYKPPIGKFLIGYSFGDIVDVQVGEEEYKVEILEIKSAVSLQEYFYCYYTDIEKRLLTHNKDNIAPFPFEHNIYVGNPNTHKCKNGVAKWDKVEMGFLCKGTSKGKKREVCYCKNCRICIINSLPYKEEFLYDFYKVFDLSDNQRLNPKTQYRADDLQLRYWESLIIQGGLFH